MVMKLRKGHIFLYYGDNMIQNKVGKSFILVILLLSAPASLTWAQISLVTSRLALGGTDFIDYSVLGPSGTIVPSIVSVQSNQGATVFISQGMQFTFLRLDQGDGWNGNFTFGDRLLYTNRTNADIRASISWSFDRPLTAFGLNIQPNFLDSFVARIDFYSSQTVGFIGSVTAAGTSTNAGDGSALFIGGLSGSSATNFTSVEVQLVGVGFGPISNFAVNQTDFTRTAVIPEPTTFAMLGVTIFAVVVVLVWRQRYQEAER
ncbi:MAG: hypothetical protein JNJ77_09870 [Planctomycetia bacterium]|nr:hypothetical protein [Planctomycetia bacterium]